MSTDARAESAPVLFSSNYVRYAVGILTVVMIVNFADRQILSILMQPVKTEMQLSDTELGFLSGLAFVLLYSALTLPIARLADQYSRVNIITICLSLWSFMTVLSGFAQNFAQLLAARVGVGIGEAGGNPSSHSLIADFVSLENRSTALGVFALGVPLGLMLGFLVGGWLEQLYGWRVAFFALGAPGLLIAVILRISLHEPPRGYSQGGTSSQKQPTPIMSVVRHMWGIPTFWHLAVGGSIHAMGTYALFQWMPSFLVRSFDMQSGEIGTWLAVIIGGGGAAGSLAGGYLADRLSARDMRWQTWVLVIACVLAVPASFCLYLAGSQMMVLAFLVLPVVLLHMCLGPAYGLTQTLSPVRMRAMAAAILLIAHNLVGLGLGPQIVGILSDWLNPAMGDESLRYAMLIFSLIFFWAAFHFWRSAKTLREDLNRAAETASAAS